MLHPLIPCPLELPTQNSRSLQIPHLTAAPLSSYLREVRELKGARTHWPNWSWIGTRLTLRLSPLTKIVQQHQMGINFSPYLCCVYVKPPSMTTAKNEVSCLYSLTEEGWSWFVLCQPLESWGQDHVWDLPISAWDLRYKLMVEWWYGLGKKCLA